MSTKTINITLLLLLIGTVAYILFGSRPQIEIKETITTRDSIVRDTIRDTIIKKVSEKVVRHDTIRINDTVYYRLPISYYEFRDTSYRFVVEGYNVKPILLETYPITHYITTARIKEITKERRINHGMNLGIGAFYGTKGFDVGVYVGYGITVKF